MSSQQLISHSADLKRLRDEGYDVDVKGGFLLLKNVPYVNSAKQIKRGTLVSKLTLAGDRTARPEDHVVQFSGEHPCNPDGSEIAQIKHASAHQQLHPEITVNHSFSAKPPGGYENYYDKMTTYAAILSSRAKQVDPTVTPRTFPVVPSDSAESPFHYIDTASSRAELDVINQKLSRKRVAIVGLGGTGSYVLDLVAKTPVGEIHLYDGDLFLQHNSFRSPGAPSVEVLRQSPNKAAYFGSVYSNMHRGIRVHEEYLAESNLDQLRNCDFVFLCLDRGDFKRAVVQKLEEFGVSFIDVGMGVYVGEGNLGGIIRVTASTPDHRDHVWQKQRIPFSNGKGNNDYERNIQIADLNALNAVLAVVKWKKLLGFYQDFENEFFSTYTVDGNKLINEDQQ